jgi:hypothetical protein
MKTAHQRIQEISKVMKRAVEKAAEKHRLMGVPMAVWKDGKVVEFLPEPARARPSPTPEEKKMTRSTKSGGRLTVKIETGVDSSNSLQRTPALLQLL